MNKSEIFSLSVATLKFQDEIQFSPNTVMEQLKHYDSESFCGCNIINMSCFYQVLRHATCMTGLFNVVE